MPSALYLCVHVRDFAAQALARSHPEMRFRPVTVLSGDPPLEYVFAMNKHAHLLGLELDMSRVQAESFPAVVLRRNRQQEEASFAELMSCAQQFSPRIETIASPEEEKCGATLVLDVSGSERLLGSTQQIVTALRQAVRDAGYEASVAASHNAYAAVLAARDMHKGTAIALGCEAEMLAPLPLTVLELDETQAQSFSAWGIHTLGQLAALPTKALVARVGQIGLRLQALARGEYSHLLVPTEEPADAALCESMELEHPVELLEPLLFLLSRMLEQITQRAAQRALAIASVETCLLLDGAANGTSRELHRTVDRSSRTESAPSAAVTAAAQVAPHLVLRQQSPVLEQRYTVEPSPGRHPQHPHQTLPQESLSSALPEIAHTCEEVYLVILQVAPQWPSSGTISWAD